MSDRSEHATADTDRSEHATADTDRSELLLFYYKSANVFIEF